MSKKSREQQAIEIFSEFTEETKTRFCKIDFENLGFTDQVFEFIYSSTEEVCYMFEDEDFDALVDDFQALCGYTDKAANKAANKVLLQDMEEGDE